MSTGSVLTIGNFDGVHIGHRAIVSRARAIADAVQPSLNVVALTFDPHPAATLRPDAQPQCLSTLAERVALLQEAGADDVVVLEPTVDVLNQSPRVFIESIVRDHAAAAVVEGADFRFGKDRAGDTQLIEQVASEMGFDVAVVEHVEVTLHDQLLAPVSSSLIRWLLSHGRVADAARCLGRPYTLTGRVARGEQRGRTIGVPTANIDLTSLAGFAVPCDGVYAGTVQVEQTSHVAAISIGTKPTFGNTHRVLEAHLIDFTGDLYERDVAVTFQRWLRDQQPFPGIDALKAQLNRDITAARELASIVNGETAQMESSASDIT